jgi:hypothetical protein
VVIDRLPHPPLVFLLPDQAPHLVDFGFVDLADHDIHGLRVEDV